MSAYYMAIGLHAINTASMDTHFNDKIDTNNNRDYAFLGCDSGNTNIYHWFATGSNARADNPTGSMFTPYPTGTERGRLYLVTPDVLVDDSSLPIRDGFVNLELPAGGGVTDYLVLTPSLLGPTQTGNFVAQYAFADIDDLFDNGWRVQNADDGAPITTQTVWQNMVSSSIWRDTYGMDKDDGNPNTATKAKEQIVSCILAFTPGANDVWVNGGVGTTNTNLRPKGALLVSKGVGEGLDSNNYRGIVPFNDSLVDY